MRSAHFEVLSVGRPRRRRAQALLLASLGWIACAAPAAFFAAGSWLGPLGVLVTGAVLQLVCGRAQGDLPFAAIGVGTIGAGAMAMATVSIAGGVPIGLLISLITLAALLVAVMRALGSTSPVSSGVGRASTLAAWGLALVLAALSFPGSERIELAVVELAPGELAPGELAPGELAPGELAPGSAPMDDPAPTALARAPSHRPRSPLPDVERAGPSLRTASRHLSATRHGGAIWLVGLLLVSGGSVAGLRVLARLRRLRDARHARRTAHGYLLDDGEPVQLEPPSTAPQVVVRVTRDLGYRGSAMPRAQLLGEGDLAVLVGSLRQRALTIALGTLVTAAAAWLPLLVLG